MPATEPTPRTWTLRFKHHRTTLLVEVDPLQHLSEVRAELLQALDETNPSGELNGQQIPKNPDQIQLGRAVDRNNLNLGYVTIEKDEEGSEASGKGRGKSTAGSGTKSSAAQMKECPQGAGLRNADVVAFKFKNGDQDGGEGVEGAEKWDVKIPTMEETYGDEDGQQDEGIGLDEG
ncbi:hypothetical protein M409DRAFT_25921 [Zasmidium cellare ATCC 36951]|uniref:Uncharacterized protein n=1 Tax=Zasmidium cellare ATCC 36951 TaxID=1080233 RepID=A0A6A6C977_ZASCE|nr:uncharacterized protein M409DRAFT_25921 [Zasmidium cellare ATCC 36951]KAF2163737.1 hypothetical protein M409DRAFT_25921 [Zasmidium cellare ATCC 36951]